MNPICPHCHNEDRTMMSRVPLQIPTYFCKVCAKEFVLKKEELCPTPNDRT